MVPTTRFEYHHITDENGKVDVGKVLGSTPETKSDIADELSGNSTYLDAVTNNVKASMTLSDGRIKQ